MKVLKLTKIMIVGYPTYVVEMLLQSYGVEGVWRIYLLLALPGAIAPFKDWVRDAGSRLIFPAAMDLLNLLLF